MSTISQFATACHTAAAKVIGEESVVIGADTILCVLSEVNNSKDFAESGFNIVKMLHAVCPTAALPIAPILKKAATTRGETFRVESVAKGGTFTTITLEQITKA